MTEAQIQSQFIQWWQMAHRGLGVPDARLLIMVPNGAYLGAGVKETRRGPVALAAIRFGQLKRQGFIQGAPDLFLAVPRVPTFAGLWIEMKRPKRGVVSDEQRVLHALLRAQGYAVSVAYGFDQAVNCVVDYLGGRHMPA